MIVLDNIIFSLQKSGGVSVVWGELLKYLEVKPNFQLLYLEYDFSVDNIVRNSINIANDRLLYLKSNGLSLIRYLPLKMRFIDEPHIFHSSYYRYSLNPYSINISTVHDFTYEYYVGGLRMYVHKWQKYNAIRHSKYVVCISESTKKDLLKFLPDVNPDNIRVIYNGVSDDYYLLSPQKSDELPFPSQSYVLFVGAREGYKNFSFTVSALRNLPYNLVIVGSSLTELEVQMLNQNIGVNRYCYVGRISNAELNVLYNNAFVLMYPSSYEGFGIPVLEAQKSGCPVIAYNTSSIPEVIGDTPLLLENLDIEEVREKFCILSHQDVRKVIVDTGIENAKRFSWDRMCQQYLDLYNEALHNF